MLTKREVQFLNFLFKRFNGELKPLSEIKDFIHKTLGISSKKFAFETAYLYYHNWSENGFSIDQEDIDRISYEDYEGNIPWQVKAVMGVVDDEDYNNYEFDGDVRVTHDGEEYRIFETDSEIRDAAESNDLTDLLCDDVGDWAEEYVYMTDTDRRIVAGEESDNKVDYMDDDEIIQQGNIQDQIDELDELVSNLEKLKSLIEEKTDQLDDLVSEMEDEEDPEQKETIKDKISDLEGEIEDLESEVEDIGDIDERKENLISETRESIKSDIYDDIYEQLGNPVDYFIHQQGIYRDVSELVASGPVNLDCDKIIEDRLDNADVDELVHLAGYSSWDEVNTDEQGWVYVVWY